MKLRPILFSTPMVQALLDGRKTQTRRVVKHDVRFLVHGKPFAKTGEIPPQRGLPMQDVSELIECPYGKVGDVLWVRESFNGQGYYRFKADNDPLHNGMRWKPSIHMPFEAARIFLEITNVRVERLQDIGRQDALREGIQDRVELEDTRHEVNYYQYKFGGERYQSAVDAFSALWQSINGEQSWTANPWVWVVEFKRINKPTP